MAIDTASKRASVQNYAVMETNRPVPDGTIAEGDRAMICNMYQGMDYDAPVPPPPAVAYTRHSILGYGFWMGF
jgi:hypothetical protein